MEIGEGLDVAFLETSDYSRVQEIVEGYELDVVSGRALKYFKEPLSWREASNKCGSLSFSRTYLGSLVTVDDYKINEWITSKDSVTWIGLRDEVEMA